MSNISSKLDLILEERQRRAVRLTQFKEEWVSLRENLGPLSLAMDELAQHPNGPDSAAEIAKRLADLQHEIDRDVGGRLSRVGRRFSRGTLNIGVGGRARVGKSTLLQNLSGLDENQIPTGESNAVTAVRSRIFHSTHRHQAEIEFHTWDSFRTTLLVPYFEQLQIGMVPPTLEGFRQFQLPDAPSSTDFEDAELRKAKWLRLKKMQFSLPSYEAYLTGGRRSFDLEGLRKFVAYPTAKEEAHEQRHGVPAMRCYLAVKDAEVYCTFPEADISRLGIIDLPGTGEIVAANENRHVAELEDEVDFVLQVSRPARYSIWEIQDAKTLELIKKSRCGADPQDFCWLLINTGKATPEQISSYKVQLRGKTSGFRIQCFDAIDRQSVHDDVLNPVLTHLAERLPIMDDNAVEYALQGTGQTLERIRCTLEEGQRMIDALPVLRKASSEDRRLAEGLRNRVGAAFNELTVDLDEHAKTGDTSEFENAIEECANACQRFLENGLGKGRNEWLHDVEERLQTDRSTGGIATRELDWARINISRQFTGLDTLLKSRVDDLQRQVASLLSERIPLTGSDPITKLKEFRQLSLESNAELFVNAVDELLDLRISYRSHFHPQVREAMVLLEPQVQNADNGSPQGRVAPVTFDSEGALDLLQQIEELGMMVIGDCQDALYQRVRLPYAVIYAAGEQFADGLLRAGGSDDAFFDFVHEHRDRIWPGRFESNAVEARIRNKVTKSLSVAQHSLSNITEING
jgi:hypothetical protein